MAGVSSDPRQTGLPKDLVPRLPAILPPSRHLEQPPPPRCYRCAREFTSFKRKRRQCASCGHIVCGDCRDWPALLPVGAGADRVKLCNWCYPLVVLTGLAEEELLRVRPQVLQRYIHAHAIKSPKGTSTSALVGNILHARNPNSAIPQLSTRKVMTMRATVPGPEMRTLSRNGEFVGGIESPDVRAAHAERLAESLKPKQESPDGESSAEERTAAVAAATMAAAEAALRHSASEGQLARPSVSRTVSSTAPIIPPIPNLHSMQRSPPIIMARQRSGGGRARRATESSATRNPHRPQLASATRSGSQSGGRNTPGTPGTPVGANAVRDRHGNRRSTDDPISASNSRAALNGLQRTASFARLRRNGPHSTADTIVYDDPQEEEAFNELARRAAAARAALSPQSPPSPGVLDRTPVRGGEAQRRSTRTSDILGSYFVDWDTGGDSGDEWGDLSGYVTPEARHGHATVQDPNSGVSAESMSNLQSRLADQELDDLDDDELEQPTSTDSHLAQILAQSEREYEEEQERSRTAALDRQALAQPVSLASSRNVTNPFALASIPPTNAPYGPPASSPRTSPVQTLQNLGRRAFTFSMAYPPPTITNLGSRPSLEHSSSSYAVSNSSPSHPPPLIHTQSSPGPVPRSSSASSPNSKKTAATAASAPSAAAADDDNDNCCKICFEEPQNAVLLDCGHMCCCYECSKNLLARAKAKQSGGECPICRAKIRKVVKVYKS